MLTISQHQNIALLTIDRPERRNALCTAILNALRENLCRLNADSTVGAIVLDGVPPGFCAGSDVRELAGLDRRGAVEHEARTAELARSIATIETPVIASVSGFALGGGLFLAASCDHIVTSKVSRWGLPEVQLGWLPPWGFAALVGRVGLGAARRLTLTTTEILGVEAHRIGLADALAGQDGSATTETALAEAQKLAKLPRDGIAATKRFFNQLFNREAEIIDQFANRLFEENLKGKAATDSLGRFAAPKA